MVDNHLSASRRAATVGMFDGVHIGHRHLLSQLRDEAESRNIIPTVVTFTSHPLQTIAPNIAPTLLTSPSERRRRIQALGINDIIELDFTPRLRAMTGSEFLTMLHRDYDVDILMMGFNNHLGSDRDTSPTASGVTTISATALPHPHQVCSSQIRSLIAQGNIDEAALLLGHPVELHGSVVSGQQIGRTLGFPTANILPTPGQTIPATGVYAARALGYPTVVNIGSRPTVNSDRTDITIEAHIIGFNGNLYGQGLTLSFIARLRSEQKFASRQQLTSAIAADIENAIHRF